jgi:hypothetical protein
MPSTHTIACPKCGSTGTFKIGISKNGSGVGSCKKCHKNVRIHLDNKGNIKKTE